MGTGLYDYGGGARWYDPSLGRFVQADSVIPGIRDTLAWDRYAYSFNNPIKYTDPSGHDPELLEFLMGAATQFTNDMTLGLVDEIANTMGVCLDCDASSAYEAGEKAGRAISSVVSATEFVMGVEAVAAGAAVIPPTVAVGASCTAGTGGACAAVALPVVGVEAVTVIAGMGVAVHGGMTIAYIQTHHIATNKHNSYWTPRFEKLFSKGGLSFEDESNKLMLEGHLGRHTNAYHQWVYDKLEAAITDMTDEAEIAAALRAALRAIAE